MTANTRLATVTTFFLALFGLPLPLRADPITLTGGTVQVAVGIHSARITLVGDGFLVRTATEDFAAPIAQGPFLEGTSINLGGLWHPTDMHGGEGTFNGVHYPELFFGISTERRDVRHAHGDAHGRGSPHGDRSLHIQRLRHRICDVERRF